MSALQVAERARDLEPERVERDRRERTDRRIARPADRRSRAVPAELRPRVRRRPAGPAGAAAIRELTTGGERRPGTSGGARRADAGTKKGAARPPRISGRDSPYRFRSMNFTNSLRGTAPSIRSATCSALEEDERRDRRDLVLHRHLRGLVHVDLGDLQLARVLVSPARPRSAPRSGRARTRAPRSRRERAVSLLRMSPSKLASETA